VLIRPGASTTKIKKLFITKTIAKSALVKPSKRNIEKRAF
jgi:hypothetical protein